MSVFNVRLRISDPAGFIAFEEVTSLPGIYKPQTAYLFNGSYYSEGGEIETLYVSDDRIQNWIDLKDEDYATCQAIKAILPQLGAAMQLKRMGAGAESTEYQTLKDTYTYYKDLLSICNDDKKSNDNNNSGRMGGSKAPVIGGGDI